MATTRTIANAWTNRTLPDIFYEGPEPVEDAVVQERAVHRIIHLLWELLEGRDDVFITGAFYICYDETDGNRRVQPDCFITFDVDAEAVRFNLPNYWVWEVGKVPDLVIEVASPSTKDNDLGPKRELYRWLGIAEYWRLDPTGGELYGRPVPVSVWSRAGMSRLSWSTEQTVRCGDLAGCWARRSLGMAWSSTCWTRRRAER